MDRKEEIRSFWKEIWIVIIGTTISLVLTIGSSQLLEKNERAQDRRLMTMMVIGNIERFTQDMEEAYDGSARADTISAWLISLPTEKLDSMPDSLLREINILFDDATNIPQIYFDKSTERIFSNSIDTWKNVNNVKFVDNVGECFSTMNLVSEYWNGEIDAYDDAFQKVLQRSTGTFTWKEFTISKLKSNEVRKKLADIHNLRCWLLYTRDMLRFYNRQNMALMDISEEELQGFMSERRKMIEIDMEEPNDELYYTPALSFDSLTTLMPIKSQFDEYFKNH